MVVVVAGGDSHTVISPLKSKKNKNKNIPGARDAYTSRAPSLVVVVMADGCSGGAGAGAGAGAGTGTATAVAGTAAMVAACCGGCGHVLSH